MNQPTLIESAVVSKWYYHAFTYYDLHCWKVRAILRPHRQLFIHCRDAGEPSTIATKGCLTHTNRWSFLELKSAKILSKICQKDSFAENMILYPQRVARKLTASYQVPVLYMYRSIYRLRNNKLLKKYPFSDKITIKCDTQNIPQRQSQQLTGLNLMQIFDH